MDEKCLPDVVREEISVENSINRCFSLVVWTKMYKKEQTEYSWMEHLQTSNYIGTVNCLYDKGLCTLEQYQKFCDFDNVLRLTEEKQAELNETRQLSIENEKRRQRYEWLSTFFDYATRYSDIDLQELWAAILAKEFYVPGAIPLSLLSAVSLMSPEQVTRFNLMSRFAIRDNKGEAQLYLFVMKNREEYARAGIEVSDLKLFERLGLIECDFYNEMAAYGKKILRYGNREIEIRGDYEMGGRILSGNAAFTKDGARLYSVVDSRFKAYNNKILESIVSCFVKRNCIIYINNQRVY